ncbi:hypothetical protein GJAV_G00030700 [Gymnothorax javanicus]|nr:hypothetical protein GJAV_G00030700 [Gymnothorax javanicus]
MIKVEIKYIRTLYMIAQWPEQRGTNIICIAEAQHSLHRSGLWVGGAGAMSSCFPFLLFARPCPPVMMPPAHSQPLGHPHRT